MPLIVCRAGQHRGNLWLQLHPVWRQTWQPSSRDLRLRCDLHTAGGFVRIWGHSGIIFKLSDLFKLSELCPVGYFLFWAWFLIGSSTESMWLGFFRQWMAQRWRDGQTWHYITKALVAFNSKAFTTRKSQQHGFYCSSSLSSQSRTQFYSGFRRKTRFGKGNLVPLEGTHWFIG